MDDTHIGIVNNFEQILKNGQKNSSISLYSENKHKIYKNERSRTEKTAQDILAITCSQIKSISKADSGRILKNRENLSKFKKSLVPVDMLLVNDEVPQKPSVNPSKFETQGISNSQLIHIIQDAEAIESNKGMTQEFDVSFISDGAETNPIDGLNNVENGADDMEIDEFEINFDDNDVSNEIEANDFNENLVVSEERELTIKNKEMQNKTTDASKMSDNNNKEHIVKGTDEKENITQNQQDFFADEVKFDTEDTIMPASPILKPIKVFKKHYVEQEQSMTYDLAEFEKFENIAIPIVQNNTDLDKAKELINSQIFVKPFKTNIKKEILHKFKEETIDERHENVKDVTVPFIKFMPIPSTSNNLLSNNFETEVILSTSLEKEILSSVKLNDVIDDGILFSSDEEDPYFCDNHDLPFTCALETSFYDQSNVLDKTMFVGFHTASNKSIQVNTESFVKAKSFLDDFEEDTKQFSLTDLVKKCDNDNSFKNHKENVPNVKFMDNEKMEKANEITFVKENDSLKNVECISLNRSTKTERVLKDVFENNTDQNPLCKNQFVGFKTANNKNISLSPKAINKAKALVNNFLHGNKESEKSIGFLPKSDENVEGDGLKLVDDDIIKEFENDEMPFVESENATSGSFKGFQTASHKKITISDAGIEKTKHILDDLDNGETLFPENYLEDTRVTVLNKKSQNIDTIHSKFLGFKTASHKNIKISKQALAKTEYIFQNIDDVRTEDLELIYKNKYRSNDLKTDNVATKMHKIKSNADIHLNIDKTDVRSNDKSEPFINKPFAGFKTASNKRINVSEKAKIASAKIFQDIDLNYEKHDTLPLGCFKETPKENDSIPVNVLDENKLTFKSNTDNLLFVNKAFEIEPEDPKTFQGFKTASNKDVKVSKFALAKSRKLLELDKNIEEIFDTEVVTSKPSNNYINDAIPVNTSSEETKVFEDMDHNIECNIRKENNKVKATKFVGFQTASNKPVKISEKALARSKMFLQEFQNDNTSEDVNGNNQMPFKDTCHDDKITDINKAILDPPKFVGFQTASNKAVKISKEAMARSRMIISKFNKDTEEKRDPFLTENNETLKKSTDAFSNAEVSTENKDITSINPAKFTGFQTASKKPVKISDDALAKSKRLLSDIDDNASSNQFSFETASNKKVKISEEAFAKTRDLFKTIDNEDHSLKSADSFVKPKDIHEKYSTATTPKNAFTKTLNRGGNLKKRILDINQNDDPINPEVNIDNIINTQVLNNFEVTLHTEDFANYTPVKENGRSNSPILSCPRAKKRKRFETPYRNESKKLIILHKENPKVEAKKVVSFSNNYKQEKRYALKDISALENDSKSHIATDPYILKFTYENLPNFEFVNRRNDVNKSILTINDLKSFLLDSVNRKIVPDNWFEIHVKLILWKLISYEIKFPFMMANICSAKNVLDQLKYRYDRELYNVQRPALRKIFERDESSSRVMVLCVVGVYVDGVLKGSPKSSDNMDLLLTDGWYTIRACLDKMLSKLVFDEKIKVGCKLVTGGAELVNCEQGVAPWEDTSLVRLKLFGNSTRRARWDARLGFHGNAAILSHLSAVKPEGGKVSKLRLFVTRVYPALYVEKFEDGSTVTRSERLEHLHQMKYETERQIALEKIYEEVEKEFVDQESQDTEVLSYNKRKSLESGSQIAKIMKKCKDPTEFRATLTSSQVWQLEEHDRAKRENLLQNIQDRVREKINSNDIYVTRNVIQLFKIRVVGVQNGCVTKGMMTIWKPNEAIQEIVVEGAWIEVLNVIPTSIRYSEIQLSAGRQTIFKKYKQNCEEIKKCVGPLIRRCCHIKDLVKNPSMTTEYNEIDTIGLIFSVEPPNKDFECKKTQPFQNVYIADSEKNIICVNFWGGIKKFGFEMVLDTGQMVACMNLQKRAGNTRKSILQFRATEFSFFTKTPKNEELRKSLGDIVKKIDGIDRRKFCEDCVVLKNNHGRAKMVENNENVSPYRFNNSDYNISKHKAFVESPLVSNKAEANVNLTGLDFESTFVQTNTQDLSPNTLLRKKKVNEKIARLKMYGEPPRLSPMHIINKSKHASSAYKSPLASKPVSTTSVASNEKVVEDSPKTTTSRKSDSSPIISFVNRTYTTNVKPVKLNFSTNVATDKNTSRDDVDHFAEDFDASPPLSLDASSCL